MKRGMLMMAAVALMAAGALAERRVYKVEVPVGGTDTQSVYTSISGYAGWSEIDRIVVTPAPATGTVTVALAELGSADTNGTYSAYTETVATSGTLVNNGTYASRPWVIRGPDGTNVTERFGGQLLKTTVTQAGTETNTWIIRVYVK